MAVAISVAWAASHVCCCGRHGCVHRDCKNGVVVAPVLDLFGCCSALQRCVATLVVMLVLPSARLALLQSNWVNVWARFTSLPFTEMLNKNTF